MDVAKLMLWLGHSNLEKTQRYVRVFRGSLSAGVGALESVRERAEAIGEGPASVAEVKELPKRRRRERR